MEEFLKILFGDFGLWLLGGVGLILTAFLSVTYQQFRRLTPQSHLMAQELRDLSETLEHLKADLERHKREVGDELGKIATRDDLTRKRLDDIHARLDHFVGQTAVNYQALSEQISAMQRGLLGKQDEIIEKQAEMLREYQRK